MGEFVVQESLRSIPAECCRVLKMANVIGYEERRKHHMFSSLDSRREELICSLSCEKLDLQAVCTIAGRVSWMYGHQQSIIVWLNDKIKPGQPFLWQGDNSRFAHLGDSDYQSMANLWTAKFRMNEITCNLTLFSHHLPSLALIGPVRTQIPPSFTYCKARNKLSSRNTIT